MGNGVRGMLGRGGHKAGCGPEGKGGEDLQGGGPGLIPELQAHAEFRSVMSGMQDDQRRPGRHERLIH